MDVALWIMTGVVMAGAATTRFRRSEWGLMAGDVVYLAAFAFVAWGWFALVPFEV